MTFRGLFVSDAGRVRALWRIAAFLLLFATIAGILIAALGSRLGAVSNWLGFKDAGEELCLTAAAVLAHLVFLRWIDRRPWSYARLDRVAARGRIIGLGALLGGTPIAAATLALVALGWLTIQSAPDGSWLMAALKLTLILAPAALFEELLSRGYVFAALSDGLTPRGAIIVTSAVFGFLHIGNDGSTPMSILLVTLAGIFLAAILLATKSLYAAWSAHFVWNWVMAVPFHVQVSGIAVPRPDYQTVDTGPDWATGGVWGPEGGAFAGIAMLAGLWFLYARFKPQTSNVERSQ